MNSIDSNRCALTRSCLVAVCTTIVMPASLHSMAVIVPNTRVSPDSTVRNAGMNRSRGAGFGPGAGAAGGSTLSDSAGVESLGLAGGSVVGGELEVAVPGGALAGVALAT